MKKRITEFSLKKIKIVLMVCLSILLLTSCISHYIGYNGYQKYKYRRSTFGNRAESVGRKVFVKDLQYSSNVQLDSFDIFIEKGYKWGHYKYEDTNLVKGSKFPFQVSYTQSTGLNYLNYYVINKSKFDSIDNMAIYLQNEDLKDTLIIGIQKFNKKWDSIGYIKVWNPDKK